LGRLAQLVQSIPISSEAVGLENKKILGRLAQLVQSIPISSEAVGLENKKILGRLAQLVQSTSFTPRGSGVRTPHRPQVLLQLILKPFKSYDLKGFFFFHTIKLFINA
jgi:hypothetical protein